MMDIWHYLRFKKFSHVANDELLESGSVASKKQIVKRSTREESWAFENCHELESLKAFTLAGVRKFFEEWVTHFLVQDELESRDLALSSELQGWKWLIYAADSQGCQIFESTDELLSVHETRRVLNVLRLHHRLLLSCFCWLGGNMVIDRLRLAYLAKQFAGKEAISKAFGI